MDGKNTKIIGTKSKYFIHGVRFLRTLPPDIREHGARQDEEAASAARDGGELRPGEQETVAQERAETVLHPGREGGAGVPENVHSDERS